jgi:hypothetical protein
MPPRARGEMSAWRMAFLHKRLDGHRGNQGVLDLVGDRHDSKAQTRAEADSLDGKVMIKDSPVR